MSIRKRPSKKAKKGYTYTVDFRYKDKYGVSRRFTKSGFKTSREAKNYELEKRIDLEKGYEITGKKVTFGYVTEVYFKNDPFLKQTSIQQRTFIYNKHMKGYLHEAMISKIDYVYLQNMMDEIGKKNSISISKSVYASLNAIYQFAINNGFVNSRPYEKLKITGHEVKKESNDILTVEQFNTLIDHFNNRVDKLRLSYDNYKILLYLGYYTGIRLGEALALERKDIDFEKNTITINKQLQEINRKPVITSTKTKKSNGVIPLSKEMKTILQEHFEKYPEPTIVIFNKKHEYLIPSSVKQYFLKLSKKLGFDFHFHMLRHTFITQLYNKGIDIKTAQELARHSNYQTTMDVYTNLQDKNFDGIIDNLYS